MIGLDTNVLVRYVVRDDPAQTATADRVIEELGPGEGFVALIVLAELHWTLTRAYGYSREQTALAVRTLLAAVELRAQDADLAQRALAAASHGADFADALITELGRAAGCSSTVTFDRGAARSAGMTLL